MCAFYVPYLGFSGHLLVSCKLSQHQYTKVLEQLPNYFPNAGDNRSIKQSLSWIASHCCFAMWQHLRWHNSQNCATHSHSEIVECDYFIHGDYYMLFYQSAVNLPGTETKFPLSTYRDLLSIKWVSSFLTAHQHIKGYFVSIKFHITSVTNNGQPAVITADQPVYSLAKYVQWKYPDLYVRTKLFWWWVVYT